MPPDGAGAAVPGAGRVMPPAGAGAGAVPSAAAPGRVIPPVGAGAVAAPVRDIEPGVLRAGAGAGAGVPAAVAAAPAAAPAAAAASAASSAASTASSAASAASSARSAASSAMSAASSACSPAACSSASWVMGAAADIGSVFSVFPPQAAAARAATTMKRVIAISKGGEGCSGTSTTTDHLARLSRCLPWQPARLITADLFQVLPRERSL